MLLDRHRKRSRQAMTAMRTAARTPAATGDQTQTQNRPRPLPAAQARTLLAHAHRARRFLSDRSVVTRLRGAHRDELVHEIERMRRVMRVLETQVEVTTRSVETTERLVMHLRRLTAILADSGVAPPGELELSGVDSDASPMPASTPSEVAASDSAATESLLVAGTSPVRRASSPETQAPSSGE